MDHVSLECLHSGPTAGVAHGLQRIRHAEGGLVLVCVLLLMALITVLCASFARGARGAAPPVALAATPSAGLFLPTSQVAAGVQARLSALQLFSRAVEAQVAATPLDVELHLLRVDTWEGEPTASRRLAEARLAPLDVEGVSDSLPSLRSERLLDLLADQTIPRVFVSGSSLRQHTTLRGLVILEPGAVVYLDDVVIEGCLVSAAALATDGAPVPLTGQRPRVVVEGALRIEPGGFLPGLAVLLPDGELLTGQGMTPALQIAGDVVASRVELDGQGALLGHVAAREPIRIGPRLERPGLARGAMGWSPVLDLGSRRAARTVAFIPADVCVSEEFIER